MNKNKIDKSRLLAAALELEKCLKRDFKKILKFPVAITSRQVKSTDTHGWYIKLAELNVDKFKFDLEIWFDGFVVGKDEGRRFYGGFYCATEDEHDCLKRHCPFIFSRRKLKPGETRNGRLIRPLSKSEAEKPIDEHCSRNSYFLGTYDLESEGPFKAERMLKFFNVIINSFSSDIEVETTNSSSGKLRLVFPDAEHRKKVEAISIARAKAYLRNEGYSVKDRCKDNLGYDLLAYKDRPTQELHVEVKGTASSNKKFFISKNEYKYMESNKEWRLLMVTEALTRNPKIFLMEKRKVKSKFIFSELVWFVNEK